VGARNGRNGARKSAKTSEARIRVVDSRKSETKSSCAGGWQWGKLASLAQSTCARSVSLVVYSYVCRCRSTHNVEEYLAAKPRDLRFPPVSSISIEAPFVATIDGDETIVDNQNPSIDFSTICPVFESTGECRHGLRCRYLGGHVRKTEEGKVELFVDEEKKARTIVAETELNFVMGDTLKQIRSKKV
jgi:tRNA-dihydrouridine synthase 3